MKQLNLRKTLLSLAVLGSFAAPVATSVAQAAPPDHAPAYGRRAKDKQDKKDKRNDRRDNESYDRNRYDNDRDYRDRYDLNSANNRNNATYTGTVTNVRAGNSFDLRANGRTYNVYTPSGVPRGLSEGDTVRVSGRPYGDNDIRNASISILNNRRDNNGRDNNYNNGRYDNGRDGNYTNGRYDPNGKLGGYGNGGRYGNNNGNSSSYQTYTGVVTNVDNNREFDIRVGGTTYNVYASSSTPRLSKNDTVRVSGQRSGDNDIRNANVTVTRDDRYNDNNGNNGDYGRYQNFTGVVTNVKNDREFDIRIGGTTYNVYASTSTRGLNKNDEVSVYGQRYGDNDIRNANVRITRNR